MIDFRIIPSYMMKGNKGVMRMKKDEQEIRTILQDLPVSVHGFCFHDDDGQPVVVINSRLSAERRLKTYRHEVEHIQNGDMYDTTYNEYGGAT